MSEESILQIHHLNKTFLVDGERIEILKDINLDIKKGEFVTIVGHSGCGKSTLLKIIAGLIQFDSGEIVRNGSRDISPSLDCGMVFQEHRLLPWLKIKDNIAFGIGKLPRAERERLVKQHLELVKIQDFANVYPSQLSGGMSQRAAIARGLVADPEILLLDEPFGALDAMTRTMMQKEILRIWKEKKTTMIMVTHDLDEALILGQRVVIMSSRPGEIRDIIKIESTAAKNRTSSDFAYYKKVIYSYFFEDNVDASMEYNI